MDYRIVLDEGLGIKIDEFAKTWNETPECRAIAEVRAGTGTQLRHFYVPPDVFSTALLAGLAGMMSNVAPGVAANALYDGIKMVLAKRGVKKSTEMTYLEKPDGTRLLIVKIEEK